MEENNTTRDIGRGRGALLEAHRGKFGDEWLRNILCGKRANLVHEHRVGGVDRLHKLTLARQRQRHCCGGAVNTCVHQNPTIRLNEAAIDAASGDEGVVDGAAGCLGGSV